MIGPFDVGPGDLDEPFWSGMAVREVRVQRCGGCHSWIWGPQWRCGTCGCWDPEWRPISAVGVVHSWTRTHHPPAPDVADAVPYCTVLVELPHIGGIRLLGVWQDGGDPSIGEPVEVTWPDDAGATGSRALCWRRRHPGTPAAPGSVPGVELGP